MMCSPSDTGPVSSAADSCSYYTAELSSSFKQVLFFVFWSYEINTYTPFNFLFKCPDANQVERVLVSIRKEMALPVKLPVFEKRTDAFAATNVCKCSRTA